MVLKGLKNIQAIKVCPNGPCFATRRYSSANELNKKYISMEYFFSEDDKYLRHFNLCIQ